MRRDWLIALAFSTALAASPAAMQWRPVDRAEIRYSEMDRDHDGVITRAEWRGSRRDFDEADWNRDGVLSGDEVRLGPRDTRPANDPASRRAEFMRLDRNNDGLITTNEWKDTRSAFNDYDVNRDSVLTQREYVGVIERAPRYVTTESRMVDVDPRVRWVYVGFVVDKGDILTFNSEGTIQLSEDSNDTAIVAGSPSGRHAPDSPLPQELAGALIARVGSSPIFAIGDQRQLMAPASGQLFLGVNDDHLGDNRGRFRVRITSRTP